MAVYTCVVCVIRSKIPLNNALLYNSYFYSAASKYRRKYYTLGLHNVKLGADDPYVRAVRTGQTYGSSAPSFTVNTGHCITVFGGNYT